jgi:hypothetical protein
MFRVLQPSGVVDQFLIELAGFVDDLGAHLGRVEIRQHASRARDAEPVFGHRGVKESLDHVELLVDQLFDTTRIGSEPRVNAGQRWQRGILGRVHGRWFEKAIGLRTVGTIPTARMQH